MLAGSQIALPDPAQGTRSDDDELTRTRKVRRGFIAEKYGVLVEALYAASPSSSSRRA
jgi:long-chain acyl-CoA synthetase